MFGLAHHQRRRRGLFKCSMCGHYALNLKGLLRHTYVHHQYNPGFHVTCNVGGCARGFSKFVSYRSHLYRKHRTLLGVEDNALIRHEDGDVDAQQAQGHENVEPEGQAGGNIFDFDGDFEEEVNMNDGFDVIEEPGFTGQNLQKYLAMFMLKTREFHILPRSVVQDVYDNVRFLVSHALSSVPTNINFPAQNDHANDNGGREDISWEATFDSLGSDYLLKKYCKSHLGLIEPIEYNLGEQQLNGKAVKHRFQYIPILQVLQQYLGQSDIWTSINQEHPGLENKDVLSGFMSGKHYRESEFFQEKPNALRIIMYTDEFEVVNPLGSKKGQQKVLAVYFVVENVESKHRSSLRHIHLALLVKYRYVQTYGYDNIFAPLIADLKKLESEGISIRVDGRDFHRFGTVVALCGDNLSSHSVGRFSCCFSAGRICRFCMARKREIPLSSDESDYVLRTPAVHQYHLDAVSTDRNNATVYGVKGPCAFSELEYFDVTKCLPPDAMHDLLEGVIPVVMKTVLRELVQNGPLTYELVTQKMSSFKYGQNDCGNKPVSISAKTLRQNDNISGSASQKLCLFRMLPFMIGEFVPDGSEVWDLYLLCRELVEICLAPVVKKDWLPYLQQIVIDHNKLFSQYSESFPCKMHYICHYHRLMSEFGPIRNMWCMRFEAKHQYFKRIADVLHNFRNVALSLATRHQFLQCWQFHSDSFVTSTERTVMDTTQIDLHNLPPVLQRNLLDIAMGNDRRISLWKTKSITIDAMKYTENDVVIVDIVQEEGIPIFGKVKYLLQCESVWYVCTKVFKTVCFRKHLHAFEVTGSDQWLVFRAKCVADFQSLDVYEVDGMCLITLKHRMSNYQIHVTYKKVKRFLRLEETPTTQKNLIRSILTLFGLDEGTEVSLQIWHSDWDDWADAEDDLQVPADRSRLRVLVKEKNPRGPPPPPQMEEIEGPQNAIPIVHVEIDERDDNTWHLHYTTPTLPHDIQQVLASGDKDRVDFKMRRRITQVLFDDTAKRTLYPTKMQYQEVARALTIKYPILKDRACNSTGYDTWRESLRNKFKKERSPIVDEEVLRRKGLFGKKRPPVDATKPPSPVKKVMRVSKENAVAAEGEDEASQQRHITEMKLLAARRNPDIGAIDDKMKRTLQHRMLFIQGHSVGDILTEYPILKLENQLVKELERVYARLTVATTLQNFILKSGDKIVDFCKPLFSCKILIAEISDLKGRCQSQKQKEELMEAACCLLIPLALGEKDVYVISKDPIGPTPTQMYNENPLEVGKSSLYMDGKIISTPSTVKDGFAAMFSAFYVYGVEYPRHAKNTLYFFQQHICRLDLNKPMPMRVLRFVNAII